MIDGLPIYVSMLFFLTVIATIWFLIKAAESPGKASLPTRLLFFFTPLWLLLTGYLATLGFYRRPDAMPPPVLAFGVFPALVAIAIYFIFFRSSFVDLLSLKWLTLLHVIRIPVEIALFLLYQDGRVPKIMTFEGWNFDIISGLTAPIVFWLSFRNDSINRTALIIWNFVALALLCIIVTIAALSFISPLQQLAFDQPNVGVTYLPFIWLPTIVVPIVLFAHLASLWKLFRGKVN